MRLTLLMLFFAHTACAQLLVKYPLPVRDLQPYCICVPEGGYVKDSLDFDAFVDSLQLFPVIRKYRGYGYIALQLVVDTGNKAQAVGFDGTASPKQVAAVADHLVRYHDWGTAFQDNRPIGFSLIVVVEWNDGELRWHFHPLDLPKLIASISDKGKLDIQNTRYHYRNDFHEHYRVAAWTRKSDSIAHDIGSAIAVDRFNAVWEGTMGGVTWMYGDRIRAYNRLNSLFPTDSVTSVVADHDDNKWFADFTTVARFDGRRWTFYDSTMTALSIPLSLSVSPDGRIYCAGFGGLSIYGRGGWTHQDSASLHLPDHRLLYAGADHKGRTWIGSFGGAVMIRDGQTTPCAFLGNLTITGMAEDTAGNCWFSTPAYATPHNVMAGLAEYDAAGQWHLFTIANSGLPAEHIESLTYNPIDHALWLCVSGVGVCRFDGNSDWQIITPANSFLPSTEAGGIAVDRDGNIWCATHAGLAELMPVN